MEPRLAAAGAGSVTEVRLIGAAFAADRKLVVISARIFALVVTATALACAAMALLLVAARH